MAGAGGDIDIDIGGGGVLTAIPALTYGAPVPAEDDHGS